MRPVCAPALLHGSVPAPVQKEVEVSCPSSSSASPSKESAASLHGEAERLQQGMRHYQLLRDNGRRPYRDGLGRRARDISPVKRYKKRSLSRNPRRHCPYRSRSRSPRTPRRSQAESWHRSSSPRWSEEEDEEPEKVAWGCYASLKCQLCFQTGPGREIFQQDRPGSTGK